MSIQVIINKITNEERYKQYIDEHIENVLKAYNQIKHINFNPQINEAIKEAEANILDHDLSKYSDEEFEGYRQYFYPVSDEEKDEELFNKAWEHHYSVNNHHPEHWVVDGVIQDMDLVSIIEMICDWLAMSMKFNNNCKQWYIENNTGDKLSERTRNIVEFMLDRIEQV